MEGIPSFIKIGGAVSEKNDHNRQKFVVLYIGLGPILSFICKKSLILFEFQLGYDPNYD